MLAIDRQQLRSSLALSQHGGSNHGLVTDLIEAQAVIVLGKVDDAVRLLLMRFGGGSLDVRRRVHLTAGINGRVTSQSRRALHFLTRKKAPHYLSSMVPISVAFNIALSEAA